MKVRPTGIFNLASSEVSSKKEFILGLVKKIYNNEPDYTDGSVFNENQVQRANSLGLDTQKIEDLLGYRMPNLMETLDSIKQEYMERWINNGL